MFAGDGVNLLTVAGPDRAVGGRSERVGRLPEVDREVGDRIERHSLLGAVGDVPEVRRQAVR